MTTSAHWIIPFAFNSPEACAQALKSLKLPHLSALSQTWSCIDRDSGEDDWLSTPHERALARAWGWTGEPGRLPFGAQAAQEDGGDVGSMAWGLMTPAHWHLARDHVTLLDPEDLALEDAESRALFESVRNLFESEGFRVAYGSALRWYLAHDSLSDLLCASLDRAIGRPVDQWLPTSPQGRLIRRLQGEVQMILYRSPLNEAREQRGALPVNSFWLSGCGPFQPRKNESVRVVDDLRRPALQQDWPQWCEAWQRLDTRLLAELKDQKDVTLTLCGERSAISLKLQPKPFWQRWATRLKRPPSPSQILGDL